ncbi:MAG: flagellar protein FliS [Sphingomonas sp.]|uniref:flagellar export chaperone FliS n=1 Tax=Sphingomonas sp. TaxID=28214 RepID=UPI0025E50D58|nr:flagellar protein FliS [Sphingomonas sp.]MBX3562943.1 flagellar protein FliS [Sphingomonas sp.]
MRYATALARDPASTYRQIDVAGRTSGADSHALVDLLYQECVAALRAAAWALERGQPTIKSERLSRATAVLFALEAGLDFERGGQVSRTLATLYHGLRQQILDASLGGDPAPLRDAADSLEDIAGAWSSVRSAS